jgi:hypothetical protein
VADQLVAQLAGDALLELLDLLVLELDDLAGLGVDQMVVMLGAHALVARPAAVAEIVAVDDALAFEQPNRAVHGR